MRKKIIIALAMAFAMVFTCVPAFAFEDVTISEGDQPYLSLGADLTDSEQQTVLDLFGIDADDLADYDVHYVTNDEEYQYLGKYVDASKIGSRALSSVVIKEGGSSDINITTHNITYCTSGMYRNALATAGVNGVDVIACGPFEISGTAALVGTIKAYENMTGEKIDDEVIEGAVDEITTTGEIAESTGDSDAVEAVIATVKEELAKHQDMTEEEITEAVRDAAEEAGLDLTEDQIQKIAQMLNRFKGIDVDWDNIKKQSKHILESFDGIFTEENKEQALNFFTRILNWLQGLFG